MQLEIHRVAVIIPAFNEGETIAKVVGSMKSYGDVIVVNDASTDNTASAAQNAGAMVITHESNLGYDAALCTGLSLAYNSSYDIAVTADADGQHTGAALEKALCTIASHNHCSLVIGRRDKFQRVSEVIYSLYARLFWSVIDPLCGLKVYRLSSFSCKDFEYTNNFVGTKQLALAVARQNDICEVDIVTAKRSGVSKFGSGLLANIKILRSMVLSIALIKRYRSQ